MAHTTPASRTRLLLGAVKACRRCASIGAIVQRICASSSCQVTEQQFVCWATVVVDREHADACVCVEILSVHAFWHARGAPVARRAFKFKDKSGV